MQNELLDRLFALAEGVSRIETKLGGLEEREGSRVREVRAISARLTDNTGKLDRVVQQGDQLAEAVRKLGKRVGALEEPAQRRMAQQRRRRRLWVRVSTAAATLIALGAALLEPVWKSAAELIVKRLFGGS